MLTKEQENRLEQFSLDHDGASVQVTPNPDRSVYFSCQGANILVNEDGKDKRRR